MDNELLIWTTFGILFALVMIVGYASFTFFYYVVDWVSSYSKATSKSIINQQKVEFNERIPTTPCPNCGETLYTVKAPIATIAYGKGTERYTTVLCKDCRYTDRVRIGECSRCLLTPMWDENGKGRDRCNHGFAVYYD